MALYYHLHTQSSEIENWPYYEFELTLENLNNLLKEKHEAEKKANDNQNKSMPNMNYKPPKMPTFRMPKM